MTLFSDAICRTEVPLPRCVRGVRMGEAYLRWRQCVCSVALVLGHVGTVGMVRAEAGFARARAVPVKSRFRLIEAHRASEI